jgi:hypothetical protein
MRVRKLYNDGGEIASTILQQLGGANRLHAMTGAYNFVNLGNGLSFKIKNQRANYIKITLTSMDLYDVEVGRIRGNTYKVVAEGKGMYAEELKPFIEKSTGMYLTFGRGYAKGGMISVKSEDGEDLMYKIDTDEKYIEVDENTKKYLSDIALVMDRNFRKLKDTYIFWYDDMSDSDITELEEVFQTSLNMFAKGGELEDDTFVMLFKGYGFVEKRGSYGTRTFYNIEHNAKIYYDPKYRSISGYVGGGEGNDEVIPYSVDGVLDFFIEHDITESEATPMADGGDVKNPIDSLYSLVKNKGGILFSKDFKSPYIYYEEQSQELKLKYIEVSDYPIDGEIKVTFIGLGSNGFNYETNEIIFSPIEFIFSNKFEEEFVNGTWVVGYKKYGHIEQNFNSSNIILTNEIAIQILEKLFNNKMAYGGNVEDLNVYTLVSSKEYFGTDTASDKRRWFRRNGRGLTRDQAKRMAQDYIDRYGKERVYIGNIRHYR